MELSSEEVDRDVVTRKRHAEVRREMAVQIRVQIERKEVDLLHGFFGERFVLDCEPFRH